MGRCELNLTKQQRLLAVIAIAMVALFMADKIVFTPLARNWKDRSARIAQLKKDVAEGTDIAVTIDTVADESAFSPLLLINDPSACTVGFAQDNFMCEYPPPTYLCPVWAQARAA